MAGGMTIGALALATDVKVPTIRYYEQIGLLPRADRTQGNQRRYGRPERERLSFIRHARDLGFSVEDIRELLALQDNPKTPCDAAHSLAARQIGAIGRRIEQLTGLQAELTRIAESCRGGRMASDCRVIHALADHAPCANDHHHAELVTVSGSGRIVSKRQPRRAVA
jgi:DNA-binding transcriptional MerR regulator